MTRMPTERELILKSQAGDAAALGQLLLMHGPRLFQYLSIRLPVSARRFVSAEDIIQQTYAAAFRDLPRFTQQQGGSFYGWLRTIAEHQLLNSIRDLSRKKRGGQMRQVPMQAPESAQSTLDLFHQLAAGGETPSRQVQRAEALEAMRVALAELSEEYREVIRRRFLLGQSWEETAAAIHRTPAAARAVADRAKRRLRDLLGRLSVYMSTR